MVAALLGLLAVSGILGRWNLAGLQVRVELPDEIYDGLETLATVRLENRKRFLPSFLVRAGCGGRSALFVTLAPGESSIASVPVLFEGRGRRTLAGLEVGSAFPVNFFVRRFPAGAARPVLVFPAPRPGPVAGEEGRRAAGGGHHLRGRGVEGEVDRIGDYRGEPRKLIHWRLSARQDALLVREFSTAAREPVIIDPDRLPGALEDRLRTASFLINRLLRESRPVGLRLGSRTVAPGDSRAHKLRLLTELALHAPG